MEHFFLWFLTWINAGVPILMWYLYVKPLIDAKPVDKARLDTNFWWMDLAWPMIVWGHVGLYGFPVFWGIFSWFGIGFFDVVYQFWMDAMINYFGTIMHFMASLGFLAGSGFWVANGIFTNLDGWITGGAYLGWSVLTFVWIGLTKPGSENYMFYRNCEGQDEPEERCYHLGVEEEAEKDDAEEIPEDATTFWWDAFHM